MSFFLLSHMKRRDKWKNKNETGKGKIALTTPSYAILRFRIVCFFCFSFRTLIISPTPLDSSSNVSSYLVDVCDEPFFKPSGSFVSSLTTLTVDSVILSCERAEP